MKLLHVLKEALEEVQKMQDQKEAALASSQKYENLYKEMCIRNNQLIGEKETLRHNIKCLIDTQSQLLSKLKEVTQSDNLFTLRTDVEVFIEGLDFMKGIL